MKVIVLDPAQDELIGARDYYLHKANAHIAEKFLEQFEETMALILGNPALGKSLSPRLHIIPVSHFPYSVIYRITPDAVIVHAVAHHRRRPGYWAKR